MRRFKLHISPLILLVASAVGLCSAAPALADATKVVQDCNANGHLVGHYSQGELQGALNGMGADVKEYTNCYDVVRRALLAASASGGHNGGGGSSSGGGGGGGGPAASATESKGKHASVSTRGVYGTPTGALPAGHGSGNPVAVGGTDIRPGAASVSGGSGVRSLPAPLIALLVVLGLAALGGGGVAIRRRVDTRDGT
jgi:hypothetical protein